MNINTGSYSEIRELYISDDSLGEMYGVLKVRIVANGMDRIHDFSTMPFYCMEGKREEVIEEIKGDLSHSLMCVNFSGYQIEKAFNNIEIRKEA